MAPEDRAALEATADASAEVRDRMTAVEAVLRAAGVQHLASYGAGAAVAELWLIRGAPERRLTVTEFAPATLEALRRALPEAEVVHHDLLADPPVAGADMHLFHRIDTELDDEQWRATFARFASERIVVVSTGVLGLRRALQQRRIIRERQGATHAGWLRTRGSFESLWRRTHRQRRVRFGDLEGWVLEPR